MRVKLMNKYKLTITVEAINGHGVTLMQATDALRLHGFNVQSSNLEYIPEEQEDHGPWVECEYGYDGCTGAGYADEMTWHDNDWMCPECKHTATQEWAEDVRRGLK